MSDLLSSPFTVGTDKYTIDQYASRSGPATRPVVVILHGVDGMVEESEKEVRKLAAQIADDGYLVFIPHYLDPAPGSTTMPFRDVLVQRTIQASTYRPRVTLAQPGVDTTRVGIVGLSLGGGFHNYDDGIVNRTMSEKLIATLVQEGVVHDSEIYREPPYPERWEHTFRPGGKADVDSRARTRKWLDTHTKT